MFFFIGAAAGLLYGLTAVGGCLLIVPLLMLLADLALLPAITLTLCLLLVLSTITAGDGIRARLPRPGAVWPAAVAAAALAPLAVWLGTLAGEALLHTFYRAALVVAGLGMLLLPRFLPQTVMWPRAGLADLRALPILQPSRIERSGWLLQPIGGALSGVLTGLLGAGASLLSLPLTGRDQADERGRATASSELLILPALLAAVTACLVLGRTADWRDTGLAIFGALAGISLARMFSLRMPLLVWQAVIGMAALILAFAI